MAQTQKNNPPAKATMPIKSDMPDFDDGDEKPEHEINEPFLKKKAAETVVRAPEEGPKLIRRTPKEAPIVNKVHPRKAYILDKKGNKQEDPEEKGSFLEYEAGEFVRHVGYVNRNGVLFPVGFKFKGGHIADQPAEYAVVLNKCPRCERKQTVDEAVQGECQNMKARNAHDDELGPCGFSAFEELDSYDLQE